MSSVLLAKRQNLASRQFYRFRNFWTIGICCLQMCLSRMCLISAQFHIHCTDSIRIAHVLTWRVTPGQTVSAHFWGCLVSLKHQLFPCVLWWEIYSSLYIHMVHRVLGFPCFIVLRGNFTGIRDTIWHMKCLKIASLGDFPFPQGSH